MIHRISKDQRDFSIFSHFLSNCNTLNFFLSGSLANGQLNGSGSKGSHKEDGLLRSKGLDGSSEDGPAKKR